MTASAYNGRRRSGGQLAVPAGRIRILVTALFQRGPYTASACIHLAERVDIDLRPDRALNGSLPFSRDGHFFFSAVCGEVANDRRNIGRKNRVYDGRRRACGLDRLFGLLPTRTQKQRQENDLFHSKTIPLSQAERKRWPHERNPQFHSRRSHRHAASRAREATNVTFSIDHALNVSPQAKHVLTIAPAVITM